MASWTRHKGTDQDGKRFIFITEDAKTKTPMWMRLCKITWFFGKIAIVLALLLKGILYLVDSVGTTISASPALIAVCVIAAAVWLANKLL